MTNARYQVGQVLAEKRYTTGRYTRHVSVVYDRGPKGDRWRAVAAFGGFARGNRAGHDAALAHDLADELNGVAALPAVLGVSP